MSSSVPETESAIFTSSNSSSPLVLLDDEDIRIHILQSKEYFKSFEMNQYLLYLLKLTVNYFDVSQQSHSFPFSLSSSNPSLIPSFFLFFPFPSPSPFTFLISLSLKSLSSTLPPLHLFLSSTLL